MKVFRISISVLLSLTLICGLSAQKNTQKTLVKSFNLKGNDVVDLDLNGEIEVKEWSSPSIRIEMLISVENGSETMLKSLVKAGRYNLISSETDEAFQISMPGLDREIMVKGSPLLDNVSYIINIPSDVNVRERNSVSAKID